jgi:hypothetical protein
MSLSNDPFTIPAVTRKRKRAKRGSNQEPNSRDIFSFAHIAGSGKYEGGAWIIGLVLLQQTMLTSILPGIQTVPAWIRKVVVPGNNTTEVDRVYKKLLREGQDRRNVFVIKMRIPDDLVVK